MPDTKQKGMAKFLAGLDSLSQEKPDVLPPEAVSDSPFNENLKPSGLDPFNLIGFNNQDSAQKPNRLSDLPNTDVNWNLINMLPEAVKQRALADRNFGKTNDVPPIVDSEEYGKMLSPIEQLLDRVESGGKSFAKEGLRVLGSMPKGLGIAQSMANPYEFAKPEFTPSYQIGQTIENLGKDIKPNPLYKNDFFTTTLPSAAASYVGVLLLGGLGAKVGMNPTALSAITGALMNATPEFEKALEKSGNVETAYGTFLANLPIGATEALPIMKLFKRINKASSGTFGKVISKTLGKLSNSNILKESFEGGVEEFTQEYFQNLATDFTAQNLYDVTRELKPTDFEGGAAGGILGFVTTMLGMKLKQRGVSKAEKAKLVESQKLLHKKRLGDNKPINNIQKETININEESVNHLPAIEEQTEISTEEKQKDLRTQISSNLKKIEEIREDKKNLKGSEFTKAEEQIKELRNQNLNLHNELQKTKIKPSEDVLTEKPNDLSGEVETVQPTHAETNLSAKRGDVVNTEVKENIKEGINEAFDLKRDSKKDHSVKNRNTVQADLMKKAGIPESEMANYVTDSEADGRLLGKYADQVIDGKLTEEEAVKKVKKDFELKHSKTTEERISKVPRSELPEGISKKILNEAENMKAELESGTVEKGSSYFKEDLKVNGKYTINTLPEWFREIEGDRKSILKAIDKIIKDKGLDKGVMVQRVKEKILEHLRYGKEDVQLHTVKGKTTKHKLGEHPADSDISLFFSELTDKNISIDELSKKWGEFQEEVSFNFGANVKNKPTTTERTSAGDQFTLGNEFKPSMPTKAKFEGKEDKSEETPLFQKEKEDKGQIDVFAEKKKASEELSFNPGDEVEFTHLYHAMPKGAKGKVLKSYIPKEQKDTWVKVDFGKNQGGQKLQATVPANVLKNNTNLALNEGSNKNSTNLYQPVKDLEKVPEVLEQFENDLGDKELANKVLNAYSRLEIPEKKSVTYLSNVDRSDVKVDLHKEEKNRVLKHFNDSFNGSQEQRKIGEKYLKEKIDEAFEKGESLISYTGRKNIFQSNISNSLSTLTKEQLEEQKKLIENLLPSNVKVEFDNTLKDEQGNPVRGKFDIDNNILSINPELADKTTAPHEIAHAAVLISAGKNKSRFLLTQNGWDGKGNITDLSNESLLKAHEAIAEKYEKWHLNKEKFEKENSKYKRYYSEVFQKLKQLFESISNLLKGQGFNSESKFYDDLSKGRFANNDKNLGFMPEENFALRQVSVDKFSKNVMTENELSKGNNSSLYQGSKHANIYEDNFERSKHRSKVKRSFKNLIKSASKTADDLITPITTRLYGIAPALKYKMRRFEYNLSKNILERLDVVDPFFKKVDSMNAKDKADFDLARKNGDNRVLSILVRKYDMSKEYLAVRKVLDNLHKLATDVGFDVPYRGNYHPRMIKDVEGFLNHFNQDSFTELFEKEAERLGKTSLSNEEKADVINRSLFGFNGNGVSLGKTGNLKDRTVETVTGELNDYYYDADYSLVKYIEQVTEAIEKRKFFGKTENSEDSIGDLVNEMDGIMKFDQAEADELKALLSSRFNAGSPSLAVSTVKDIMYTGLLANPLSSIRQFGDLAVPVARSGLVNTVKAMTEVLTNKGITLKDIGISPSHIAYEFADKRRRNKMMQNLFKATGFEYADRFGKATLINAQINRFKTLAAKRPGILRNKLEPIFGNETDSVIKDLNNNKESENVMFLLFNELADTQPITLSEMPKQYLDMKNGRIIYMLKTFFLRRLDLLRNEVVMKIKNPKTKAEGWRNAFRYGVSIMAIEGGTDLAIDWIKSIFSDKEFKPDYESLFLGNLLKLFALNKFSVDKVLKVKPSELAKGNFKKGLNLRGDLVGFAADLTIPPINMFLDPFKDYKRTLKYSPLKPLYYWLKDDTKKNRGFNPYGTNSKKINPYGG